MPLICTIGNHHEIHRDIVPGIAFDDAVRWSCVNLATGETVGVDGPGERGSPGHYLNEFWEYARTTGVFPGNGGDLTSRVSGVGGPNPNGDEYYFTRTGARMASACDCVVQAHERRGTTPPTIRARKPPKREAPPVPKADRWGTGAKERRKAKRAWTFAMQEARRRAEEARREAARIRSEKLDPILERIRAKEEVKAAKRAARKAER